MKLIRNQVLECLYSYSSQDEELISLLNQIIKEQGPEASSVIINVLTHLDLPAKEAQHSWQEIVTHRREMSQTLGRNVKLRTAICDYFCSIQKSLKNPMVVEIHIFEDTLKNIKFDYLTGLYTRLYFDESLEREVARAKRYDTELSLLFFDLDDFKKVNDTYGHDAGDYVLQTVAESIRTEIRSEDIAARYGGEEIIVIMPETGKVEGLILGERIRRKIANMPFVFNDRKISQTISGGITSFPIDMGSAADLVKFADTALYQAKAEGKNTITSYSKNRRRYVRVDFMAEIEVREINFDEVKKKMRVNAIDISQTGLLFESNSPFSIGSNLQLHLPFETFDVTSHVFGTVVRVELLDSSKYDIGVSFLEIDETSKNDIFKYLLSKLESR